MILKMSNINLDILVRKNVLDMNSYSSARDEFENKKENLVFLDANESPFQNDIMATTSGIRFNS